MQTRNTLESNARTASVALLNARLADTIDLALAAKQAHWNVRGPGFIAVHEMLDTLRTELDAQKIAHAYLDGSMPARARQAEVDRFQASPDVPVFLLSLKAGGTGLNLTGADTVVHFDPWWNPAAEAQATDRAHRIGQTRVVTSYKLIAAGSVALLGLLVKDYRRTEGES